jgi:hypothetical protein
MVKWTPSIGWGWWILIHAIAIPVIFYIGMTLKA